MQHVGNPQGEELLAPDSPLRIDFLPSPDRRSMLLNGSEMASHKASAPSSQFRRTSLAPPVVVNRKRKSIDSTGLNTKYVVTTEAEKDRIVTETIEKFVSIKKYS